VSQTREHIHTIISTIDSHDAGILDSGIYVCPCKFRGTEQEWEQHVADLIDEATATQLEPPETA
jgi:hypothetical protein